MNHGYSVYAPFRQRVLIFLLRGTFNIICFYQSWLGSYPSMKYIPGTYRKYLVFIALVCFSAWLFLVQIDVCHNFHISVLNGMTEDNKTFSFYLLKKGTMFYCMSCVC